MRLNQHAIERAKERYGIDLSPEGFAALTEQCRDGAPIKATDGDEVHHLILRGTDMYALYCRGNNAIVTFLPPTVIEDTGHVRVRIGKKARQRINAHRKARKALVEH